MRIRITTSKNSKHFGIIEDVTINGKRTTKVVENIGNYQTLVKRANGKDPIAWLNEYLDNLNKERKIINSPIIIKKSPNKQIPKNLNSSINIGYLFLKDIYYNLGLNVISKSICDKYKFNFDLNDILEKLIYSRILFPASKLKSLELSKKFFEQPNFDYQHIERALPILFKENDYIQSQLYKNSKNNFVRNNRILYYDCTNFYFEIEQDDDLRKYGASKEFRPNPIVQMGLFMDGDGIPLSMCINPGNTNEQITLRPLEEKIIKDFNLAEIVVCTDAGLASNTNRKFNNTISRKFITTQSIKKLKKSIQEDVLNLSNGWKKRNSNKLYDISELINNKKLQETYYDEIFYKERIIKDKNLEQRLIISYSVKYQQYQKNIRNKQIERANNKLKNKGNKILLSNQNDPKRFIKLKAYNDDGEFIEGINYELNNDLINQEEIYDGFYAVCTNLEDEAEDIIKVNSQRWQIEESFRIMKSEFKTRPVYHRNPENIQAHFLICFLSLTIYRLLEKKIHNKHSVKNIIETLRNMYLKYECDQVYLNNYIRTDLTDELHDAFGFRTDYEVMNNKAIKEIIKKIKRK